MLRFLILAMVLLPAAALAQTVMPATSAVAGNLPPGFYPGPPCSKPDKKKDVGSPSSYSEQDQIAIYNFRVMRFNKAVIAFNGCTKTYLDNSQHDIERILNTVNTQVAQARGTAPPPPPAANGNMPPDFYPRSPCVKPDQATLGAQPAVTDRKAMAVYNLKVTAFNQQAVTFNACLKTYQDNAQRDIAAIQAAAHAATAGSATP